MKKTITSLLFVSVLSLHAFAQQEITAFTATGSGLATTITEDYECIGINPANLISPQKRSHHSTGKTTHIGFLETGASIYSSALSKKVINDDILAPNAFDLRFNAEQKRQAAQQFSEKGIAANIDIQLLGASTRIGIGVIGFSWRVRGSSYMRMNNRAADIIFNGFHATYFDSFATVNGDTFGYSKNPQPISRLTDGSKINTHLYAEYNLSYALRILDIGNRQLNAGIGIKYIQGYGILDIESKNGNLTAFSSFSPAFKINYGVPAANSDTSGKLTPVGQGFGFDIGVNYIINHKLKLSLAINDIGSVTYTGNLFQVSDTTFRRTNAQGLNNYNFYTNYDNLIGDKGIFKLKTLQTKKVSLPTNLRLGASYQLLKNLLVGADLYVPLADVPGNLQGPAFALGGQIKLAESVKLSSGLSVGGNSGFNIPLGICFAPGNGSYEIGIATRDILILVADANPHASIAFGFLRFGF